MIKWIEEIIHPPGIQKKNRLSLFATIGEIGNRLRTDALKAFNAHFPYLCDDVKLAEHGSALLIPRLADDTPKEYRDRVATASFFLMRAGERAYILEQLSAHFGGRYVAAEEFLQLYVKILDLNDQDRTWVYGFLDELLDPNISLTVADWFRFVEQITVTDSYTVNVKKRIDDFFPYRETLRYDGRFLCDQGEEVLCDGLWLCDGSVHCARFKNAVGTITDTIYKSIFCGGSFICDGRVDCSGYEKIAAEGALPLPIVPSDAASDQCKTVVTINVMADTAAITDFFLLAVTKLLRCDGSKTPSCSLCDGSIVCDGSYTGFNGRYYREDIFQEVL